MLQRRTVLKSATGAVAGLPLAAVLADFAPGLEPARWHLLVEAAAVCRHTEAEAPPRRAEG